MNQIISAKKIILILSLMISSISMAVQMTAHEYEIDNNGEKIMVKGVGDEWLNYLVSAKDGTILKFNKDLGLYTIAIYDTTEKRLAPSSTVYTENTPSAENGVATFIQKPSKANLMEIIKEARKPKGFFQLR